MNTDIFETAKKCISSSVIKALFPDEKSYVEKNEYWIRSPLRNDENPGSFSINLNTGLFHEFATGYQESGDLVDLVSMAHGISKKEAAEKIIKLSGNTLVEKEKQSKYEKPEAIIPIPKEASERLSARLKSQWSIDKYGEKIAAWPWRDVDQNVLWVVVRHFNVKKNKKEDVPYYWGVDGKWHQGYPIKTSRPLYGWHNYKGQENVLIVEGQTSAEPFNDDWIVLTWAGGASSVNKANWQLGITIKKLVIWPDNDLAGLQAANQVAEILKDHNPEVLKIPASKPSKWDKADAEKDGIDILNFIQTAERKDIIIDREFKSSEVLPFRILGYTDKVHWFIPFGAPIPFGITRGTTSLGSLLELAPEQYWATFFPGQKSAIDTIAAYDDLFRESQKKGYFSFNQLRGAGVWRDENRLVINTGRDIINQDGTRYSYKKFETKNYYIQSQKSFGELTGEKSTAEEGRLLIDLFKAQGFTTDLELVVCLGWSLIAPFSTYLKWRPHIWLTGPKEIGKSYLLEEIITPLCGPIAHVGSGKDTEAGVKRAGIDGGCFIMDEMEPRTKSDRENLDRILGLVRNASSDSSSKISNAGQGKEIIEYSMRQSFLLSSIVVHFGDGNAIKSRFFVCNLRGNIDFDQKKKQTKEIMVKGILKDPGRFRRRIFSMLPIIEKNMEELRDIIFEVRGSQRDADNLAPLLSAVFSICHEGQLTDKYKNDIVDRLSKYKREIDHDEDALIREIFESMVKVDLDVKTIGNLIESVIGHDNSKLGAEIRVLGMYGIRITEPPTVGEKIIAFSINNKNMKSILKDTFFSSGYADVLKRHKFALEKTFNLKIDGAQTRCVALSANGILSSYFGVGYE